MRTSIARGTASTTGAKFENAGDAGADQPVGGILGGTGRRGDDADADALRLHDLRQLVEVAHPHTAQHRADLRLIDVDDSRDRETALAEPAVTGKCLAEVAGADDDDRPVVGEAELAADLVDEIGHLVADAAGAVAAEVAEVLADLGCIDAAEFGEALGGDAVDALVTLFGEDPQVHGQAGDGGIRDASARAFGSHTWDKRYALVHTFTKQQALLRVNFCHADICAGAATTVDRRWMPRWLPLRPWCRSRSR